LLLEQGNKLFKRTSKIQKHDEKKRTSDITKRTSDIKKKGRAHGTGRHGNEKKRGQKTSPWKWTIWQKISPWMIFALQ